MASVAGAVSVSSVSENYGNAQTATIETLGNALNITAATWLYADPSSDETYSQSGNGLTEITDSPNALARISGGYTTEEGTVTSTHGWTETMDDPNHGMIRILFYGATSISDNDDVDTVSTPPTDGQVLTWSSADNTWQPGTVSGGGGGVTSIIAGDGISVDQATGDVTVTATGGGGGGAVDSVNGETGVVSLGIEDMDDFSYVLAGNTPPYNWVSVEDVGPGEISFVANQLNVAKYDADGVDQTTNLRAVFNSSNSLTVTDATGAVFTLAITAVAGDFLDQSAYHRIVFNSSNGFSLLGSDAVNVDKTGPSTLSSPDFTGQAQNPQNGEVLQWDAGASTWRPGTVPLGAYQLTDVLDYTAAPASPSYFYDTEDGSEPPGDGQWHNGGNILMVNVVDANGVTMGSEIQDMTGAGNTIVVTWDDGTPTEYTPSSVSKTTYGGETYMVFFGVSIPGGITTVTVSTPLDPAATLIADGYTLVWSDADQEWKPSQPFVTLATLQAEVAASTDFADFQSRIAAL